MNVLNLKPLSLASAFSLYFLVFAIVSVNAQSAQPGAVEQAGKQLETIQAVAAETDEAAQLKAIDDPILRGSERKPADDASLKNGESTEFAHPGVAHSAEDVAFVKEKIKAEQEPWVSALAGLKRSRRASLDYEPSPREHVERGPYNDPNIGSSEFTDDGKAAYVHALLWAIEGDEAHAKKAAEIVDAWSGTLKSISNHDAKLLVGMNGYQYCIAAELLKHTWDGWPADRQARFATMIRDQWYPLVKDFYPTANGNWDAAMMQVMIAMGVFLDDREMVDRVVDYYRDGEGNGAIGNYFNDFGECQESGRDQGHTQMGLEFLSNTCQTAWIQGIDLYGAKDNRLRLGFEYTAKYNLGQDVPYERFRSYEGRYNYPEISDDSRGRLRPMYEKVLRHYQDRMEIESPYTAQVVAMMRTGKTRVRGGRRDRERNRERDETRDRDKNASSESDRGGDGNRQRESERNRERDDARAGGGNRRRERSRRRGRGRDRSMNVIDILMFAAESDVGSEAKVNPEAEVDSKTEVPALSK